MARSHVWLTPRRRSIKILDSQGRMSMRLFEPPDCDPVISVWPRLSDGPKEEYQKCLVRLMGVCHQGRDLNMPCDSSCQGLLRSKGKDAPAEVSEHASSEGHPLAPALRSKCCFFFLEEE